MNNLRDMKGLLLQLSAGWIPAIECCCQYSFLVKKEVIVFLGKMSQRPSSLG